MEDGLTGGRVELVHPHPGRGHVDIATRVGDGLAGSIIRLGVILFGH